MRILEAVREILIIIVSVIWGAVGVRMWRTIGRDDRRAKALAARMAADLEGRPQPKESPPS